MKLWASLRDHPKWVPLSLELRGAWVTLALIACAAQPRRGEIASRAHASALLAREAPNADVEELVDRLLAAGLLDSLPGGRIGLHDFNAWQVPPSRTRDGERVRKQEQRSRRPKGGVGTEGHVSQGEREERDRFEERSLSSSDAAEGASLVERWRTAIVNLLGDHDEEEDDLIDTTGVLDLAEEIGDALRRPETRDEALVAGRELLLWSPGLVKLRKDIEGAGMAAAHGSSTVQ